MIKKFYFLLLIMICNAIYSCETEKKVCQKEIISLATALHHRCGYTSPAKVLNQRLLQSIFTCLRHIQEAEDKRKEEEWRKLREELPTFTVHSGKIIAHFAGRSVRFY